MMWEFRTILVLLESVRFASFREHPWRELYLVRVQAPKQRQESFARNLGARTETIGNQPT